MVNIGYRGWKILKEMLNGSPTGNIIPNIQSVSDQAIINGSTNTITFIEGDFVSPSGGIDGNIWYNISNDSLYKKISGNWVLLTDRHSNQYYVAPIDDFRNCPLPNTIKVYKAISYNNDGTVSLGASIIPTLDNDLNVYLSGTYKLNGQNTVITPNPFQLTITAGYLDSNNLILGNSTDSITEVSVTILSASPNPNGNKKVIF